MIKNSCILIFMSTKKQFINIIPLFVAFALLTSACKSYSYSHVTADSDLRRNLSNYELVISVLPGYNLFPLHIEFQNQIASIISTQSALSGTFIFRKLSAAASSASQIVLQLHPRFSFTNDLIIKYLHKVTLPYSASEISTFY